MRPSLHHLALRTADVAALAGFYSRMLGLDVVRASPPRSIWLGLGGDAVLMIEMREPGEPAPSPGTMELFALRVDAGGRAVVRQRALDAGCYDGETAFTVYLRDPEGRRVAVSTYDFATDERG